MYSGPATDAVWLACKHCGADVHVEADHAGHVIAVTQRACGRDPYKPCWLSDSEVVNALNEET